MFRVYTLALLFILRLRFPTSTPIIENITRRYGANAANLYKSFFASSRKLTKVELDIKFLNSCIAHKITPKFLKFKLYRSDLHSTDLYHKFQTDLLEREYFEKLSTLRKLEHEVDNSMSLFRGVVSRFDFMCLNLRINESLIKFKRSTRDRLDRKLFKLGCKLDLNAGGHPNAVINLSSYQLGEIPTFLWIGFSATKF